MTEMTDVKRQYRVNQTILIKVKTDIFDTKIPTAQQVEEEIAFAIMDRDIKVEKLNTTFLWIEDKTR